MRELERQYLDWRDELMHVRFSEKRSEYLKEWGGTK